MSEHAVIIKFDYGSTDLEPLFELEEQLEAVLEDGEHGEYDGNEIAVDGSDGFLYLYGSDAENLYNAIKPILLASTAIKNAVATLRYGPPDEGVREVIVPVSS